MRVLPPALKAYFDSKHFILAPSLTDFWLSVVSSCVGITEVGADNCGPMVELFQSVVSTPHGQPWCVDFIQGCIAYVEAAKGVPSDLPPTQGVLDLWNRSKLYNAVQPPLVGDLILWRLGHTLEGHCGVITAIDSLTYSTIEGNTSDNMTKTVINQIAGNPIDRNGDGVYAKKRAKGGTRTFTELGFLRVF